MGKEKEYLFSLKEIRNGGRKLNPNKETSD